MKCPRCGKKIKEKDKDGRYWGIHYGCMEYNEQLEIGDLKSMFKERSQVSKTKKRFKSDVKALQSKSKSKARFAGVKKQKITRKGECYRSYDGRLPECKRCGVGKNCKEATQNAAKAN